MRRRESELLVLVRDARGVREETQLRVHAKFDDEEKITVRYFMRRRKAADAAVSSSEHGVQRVERLSISRNFQLTETNRVLV